MTIKERSDWKNYKLNELGLVGRGKSRHRPRNDSSLYQGRYPFIQTGDVKAANLYITEYSQTYNEIGLAQSKLWDSGTLLITIAANIADTAILKIEACFPDSIVGFICDPKKSDTRFVKYYIDLIKLQMQSISKGTTQDNLSLDKLLTFDFLMPDIGTQHRIADILSAYDDLIENNARRIKILEEMAQLLYREWFVNFRFPGHEDVELIESAIGLIPEGWEIASFTELADIHSGGTPSTKISAYWNGDICFFTPRDVGSSFYTLNTEKKITYEGLTKCSSKLYPKNTVFITARGTVGKVVMPGISMAMNQTNYALSGRDGINQYFIFLSLKDSVDWLKTSASGAVFDTIIMNTFQQLKVVKPNLSIIQSFGKLISPIFDSILNLQRRNENLRQTRDQLLPKLISGEIDVEALDLGKLEMGESIAA